MDMALAEATFLAFAMNRCKLAFGMAIRTAARAAWDTMVPIVRFQIALQKCATTMGIARMLLRALVTQTISKVSLKARIALNAKWITTAHSARNIVMQPCHAVTREHAIALDCAPALMIIHWVILHCQIVKRANQVGLAHHAPYRYLQFLIFLPMERPSVDTCIFLSATMRIFKFRARNYFLLIAWLKLVQQPCANGLIATSLSFKCH